MHAHQQRVVQLAQDVALAAQVRNLQGAGGGQGKRLAYRGGAVKITAPTPSNLLCPPCCWNNGHSPVVQCSAANGRPMQHQLQLQAIPAPLACWFFTMCALDSALIAHTSPVPRCRARLTRPKLPVPSTRPTSKSSSRHDSSLRSCGREVQRLGENTCPAAEGAQCAARLHVGRHTSAFSNAHSKRVLYARRNVFLRRQ